MQNMSLIIQGNANSERKGLSGAGFFFLGGGFFLCKGVWSPAIVMSLF